MTNSDGIPVTTWANDFETAGIAQLAYVPPFNTTPSDTFDWPTLGSMISSGKRVVIFLDSGADQSIVDYILPEFTYMWETPFDQTDPSFPCTVNRPPDIVGQFPTGRLAVVNHFLDTQLSQGVLIPDTSALNVTNGVSGTGSLGEQAISCAALYNRYPNFFLVDCRPCQMTVLTHRLRCVQWFCIQGCRRVKWSSIPSLRISSSECNSHSLCKAWNSIGCCCQESFTHIRYHASRSLWRHSRWSVLASIG